LILLSARSAANIGDVMLEANEIKDIAHNLDKLDIDFKYY
jgi:hypothetical protein